MGKRLRFELVPDGCWYVNLRSHLSKSDWERIKRYAKRKADGRCMICGKITNQLDAHEQWSYDEKRGIQRLEDIIAVCKDCHSVIHIGRTQLYGDIERAENHYMKVNGVSYSEFRRDLGEANEKHKRLNKVSKWVTDVSLAQKILDGEI